MNASGQLRVKGIIFDLFHTLTGRESEWSSLPWTSDVLGIDRALWDELLHFGSRLTGELQDPHEILRALAQAANANVPEERIRDAARIRTQRFRECLAGIPRVNIETLTALRAGGFRLGLISNADVMEVAAWRECPAAELFDAAVFSCAAGCVKPEPAIYHKCLDALALSPKECLYVGDGGSNELIGAREVGLTTVFLSEVMSELWPERVPQRLAVCDYHLERLPDILKLVRLA